MDVDVDVVVLFESATEDDVGEQEVTVCASQRSTEGSEVVSLKRPVSAGGGGGFLYCLTRWIIQVVDTSGLQRRRRLILFSHLDQCRWVKRSKACFAGVWRNL